MTEDDLRRHQLDKESRSRARHQYWSDRDYDSYECPDCGRRGDHPDVDGIDVHHRDEDPRNNDPENLVGLCRRCHYARHGRSYDPLTVDEWQERFRGELLSDRNSDMRFTEGDA